MIRKIVISSQPSIRDVSIPVVKFDQKTKNLARDLIDTLKTQKDPEGVGLAASQVGKNVRMFVMEFKKGYKIIINPKILKISPIKDDASEIDRKAIMEGCLSAPNYYGPVLRAKKINISFNDLTGIKKYEEFRGFPAHIIQHEIDHLNGILFVDRLIEQKKSLYLLKGDEWHEVDI